MDSTDGMLSAPGALDAHASRNPGLTSVISGIFVVSTLPIFHALYLNIR